MKRTEEEQRKMFFMGGEYVDGDAISERAAMLDDMLLTLQFLESEYDRAEEGEGDLASES